MVDKILEVSCNGLTKGGVQQVIMEIIKNLSTEYVFDILVFTSNKEYYDEEFLKYGGKIFRIPNKKSKLFKYDIDMYFRSIRIIKGTYKILKENGPYKAIHCHNYFESALCLIAAKLAGVKIRIVHSHNDLSNVKYSITSKLLQKIYKIILNKLATCKIGCSERANRYLFGKKSYSSVINNAIDLKSFNPDGKKYQKDKCLKILHVGNFGTQKNQLFLIDLARELLNRKIEFYMTLVGGKSEYLNLVNEKINKLNVQEKIKILPQDTNIPNIMWNSDLFIFPSQYEGLGIVLIEAQAMGLHCIVSQAIPFEADLGNIEYINNFDINEWCDKIEENITTSKKFVDMSAFNVSNIMNIYKKIYNGGNL